MNLKLFTGLIILMMGFSACKGKPTNEADHHGHDHAEDEHGHKESVAESIPFTGWTNKTELFLERPDLKEGQPAEFLAHLTILNGFKPMTEGSVSVVIQTDAGEKIFSVSEPSRPGIFKPVITLEKAGQYKASLLIRSKQVNDQHDLGTLEVHGHEEDGHRHEKEEPETGATISFLKEQQWQTDFATASVEKRTVHKTLSVPGVIQASTRDRLLIQAPVDGIIEGPLLPLGASLQPDQSIIQIRSTEGLIPVLSKKPAVVAVVHVSAGDHVKAGQTLFTVLDLSNVWVEARIYEADLPTVGGAPSATVEIPGRVRKDATFINSGGALDSATRTVPFFFEMSNENGQARVGMTAQVNIRTGERTTGPALPVSALVDDGGQAVAYVQVEGEAFERRQLTVGPREGDWIPVLSGLRIGERVVTKGGYQLHMASSSGSIPAHLH